VTATGRWEARLVAALASLVLLVLVAGAGSARAATAGEVTVLVRVAGPGSVAGVALPRACRATCPCRATA
jgi:hypothetical protein